MVLPKTKLQQLNDESFKIDQITLVIFWNNEYGGKVFKNTSGVSVQAMPNLNDTLYDVINFKKGLSGFKVKSENIHELHNPTYKDIWHLKMTLGKEWADDPYRKHCIFYLFACHGVSESGLQQVLLNEFYPKFNYY